MALKLKSLKSLNIIDTTNPDQFVRDTTIEQVLHLTDEIPNAEIKYDQWKRVKVDDGKLKTKLVQEVLTVGVFKEMFLKDVADFKEHTERIANQFREVKNLKENLPNGHVIVQMDFAENYTCRSFEEVQSAYWNANMVTLHPVVIYLRANGEPLHYSYVIISDSLSHNSNAVLTFLNKRVPEIKTLLDLQMIHYLTNSPTSQYRNKMIFSVVANHHELFGVDASWMYFGVGGTVKRLADQAVKSGHAYIQDAMDFRAWAFSIGKSSSMRFRFVSSEDFTSYDQSRLNPVCGTMQIHQIVGIGNNQLKSRNLSCFCRSCFSSGKFLFGCEGWSSHCIIKGCKPSNKNELDDEPLHDNQPDQMLPNLDTETDIHVQFDDFVAAIYDNRWFIGKIEEIDNTDNEILVNFMVTCCKTSSFKWVTKRDEIWICHDHILCKIDPPIVHGKSKRMYKLSNDTLNKIEHLFERK
jgi:hypothetical protein